MKKIAVLGTESFTLGFQLAGIRTIVNIHDTKDVLDNIHALRQDPNIGIVITEEEVMGALDGNEKEEIDESIEPVFVTISPKDSSESIRKLIIKSVGVDLWKGG